MFGLLSIGNGVSQLISYVEVSVKDVMCWRPSRSCIFQVKFFIWSFVVLEEMSSGECLVCKGSN